MRRTRRRRRSARRRSTRRRPLLPRLGRLLPRSRRRSAVDADWTSPPRQRSASTACHRSHQLCDLGAAQQDIVPISVLCRRQLASRAALGRRHRGRLGRRRIDRFPASPSRRGSSRAASRPMHFRSRYVLGTPAPRSHRPSRHPAVLADVTVVLPGCTRPVVRPARAFARCRYLRFRRQPSTSSATKAGWTIGGGVELLWWRLARARRISLRRFRHRILHADADRRRIDHPVVAIST